MSRVSKIAGGTTVAQEAETALDFLSERRDFWSQQKPDYENVDKKLANRSKSLQKKTRTKKQ